MRHHSSVLIVLGAPGRGRSDRRAWTGLCL